MNVKPFTMEDRDIVMNAVKGAAGMRTYHGEWEIPHICEFTWLDRMNAIYTLYLQTQSKVLRKQLVQEVKYTLTEYLKQSPLADFYNHILRIKSLGEQMYNNSGILEIVYAINEIVVAAAAVSITLATKEDM